VMRNAARRCELDAAERACDIDTAVNARVEMLAAECQLLMQCVKLDHLYSPFADCLHS